MEVEILKFDNSGRGIGYLDNKIVFVPKTIPGDIVSIEITKEKKDYYEGVVKSVLKPSKKRVEPICPFFNYCGGCDLMQISLSDAIDYKIARINNLLKRNDIDYNVNDFIKSNSLGYRNKITLKVKEGKIGFYEGESHNLVEIDKCIIANNNINSIIKDLEKFNIIDGEIIIRANYKGELLIAINSSNDINNIDYFINKYTIAGIVLNDDCIYGDNYFIDKINDYIFKVSYNSFFQVNPLICSKLFDLVEEATKESQNIIDLYSGVGTLSIVSSKTSGHVLGVEIIENAVMDANLNKKLNNKNNVDFICSDASLVIEKITSNFDTIILDPPRSGVSGDVLDKILEEKINKIVYVSCNSITLVRDLKILLNNYKIENIKLLDMFPNTEHVESICILERK